MAAARVQVVESVRAAIAFARLNVPRVAGVLVALMLITVASWAAGLSPLGALLVVASLLLWIMANAALLRLALTEEHSGDRAFRIGPMGFQWGAPENRLLGAVLLLAFLVLLAFLFWFVIAVLGGTAATVFSKPGVDVATASTRPDSPAMVTASVLALVLVLAFIWAKVRVCLCLPATVDARQIQVFATWKLTHGHFWPIFAAGLLLQIPVFLIWVLIQLWRPAGAAGLGLALLLAAVNAVVELPLMCGLYVHLYRQLRPTAALLQAASSPTGPWG